MQKKVWCSSTADSQKIPRCCPSGVTDEGSRSYFARRRLGNGFHMHAAVAAIEQEHPQSILVAVPVAAREACDEFRNAADETICLTTPESFLAVGLCYETFPQLTDEEVREFLKKADEFHATSVSGHSA